MILIHTQLHDYFKRIGYEGSTKISEKVLQDLIWKHVITIPFENLNMHTGATTNVEGVENIFNKIVNDQRGGWCYEVNVLFFYVLKTMGFDVKLQLSSVFDSLKNIWRFPQHCILIVNLNEKIFLIDVGFGNMCPVQPIQINSTNEVQRMKNGIAYSISKSNEDNEYLYTAGFNDKFIPQYKFKLTKHSLELQDLIEPNEWSCKNPDSPFVNHAIVRISTTNGFIRLLDDRCVEYKNVNGVMESIEHKFSCVTEYSSILEEYFGIKIPIEQLKSVLPARLLVVDCEAKGEMSR